MSNNESDELNAMYDRKRAIIGDMGRSSADVEAAAKEYVLKTPPSGGDQDFSDTYWTDEDIEAAFKAGTQLMK